MLSQSYSDFDLLVLDDCSIDNTVDIVNSFKDSRIRLVCNEVNLGLAENLNKGIELADTEFIARMDGDDIACPLWLEKGVATLDSRPEVGICSFGFEFFGDKTLTSAFSRTQRRYALGKFFMSKVMSLLKTATLAIWLWFR